MYLLNLFQHHNSKVIFLQFFSKKDTGSFLSATVVVKAFTFMFSMVKKKLIDKTGGEIRP
jgi:hypothetical protein